MQAELLIIIVLLLILWSRTKKQKDDPPALPPSDAPNDNEPPPPPPDVDDLPPMVSHDPPYIVAPPPIVIPVEEDSVDPYEVGLDYFHKPLVLFEKEDFAGKPTWFDIDIDILITIASGHTQEWYYKSAMVQPGHGLAFNITWQNKNPAVTMVVEKRVSGINRDIRVPKSDKIIAIRDLENPKDYKQY